MRFDCPRKEFFEAIGAANAAASQRTALPILQSLKVEAGDGFVRVLGCDGEMWVERTLACHVQEPGAICVQARLFYDLVSSMPDGAIEVKTLDGHGVMLSAAGSEYRMLSLEPEDFPEPPPFGGESELRLPMGLVREAVDSVAYAVSSDSHRQVLTGVLFLYNGARLTLVATDTHRLAVRMLDQEGAGDNVNAVVPEKALKSIKGLPIPDDSEVKIEFGEGRLGVSSGGAKVVAQLLAGTFPNWERVVPKDATRTWTVEKDQLAEKTKRALILARDNAMRVRFKGDGEQIIIAAKSEEKGEAKEELPMVASNGDIEIAFNGKYVQDAIGGVRGPGVLVEMTENSRAALFKSADEDEHYFCVIMPMALA